MAGKYYVLVPALSLYIVISYVEVLSRLSDYGINGYVIVPYCRGYYEVLELLARYLYRYGLSDEACE